MDVPARQSYIMAVVPPEERSAAGGITGVARTTGAAISPLLAGFLFARPSLISVPFFLAGGLKIVYDILLYYAFRAVQPPDAQHEPLHAGVSQAHAAVRRRRPQHTSDVRQAV